MMEEFFSSPDGSLQASALVGGLVFGFANSLHCVGMCGPLVAATHIGRRGGVSYHLARLGTYGALGALAGWLGGSLNLDRFMPSSAVFAFVLAGVMVLTAFGIGRQFGSIPMLGDLVRRSLQVAGRLPATWRGAALGAVTPLLPCGLLYAALVVAAACGEPSSGGSAMIGFAIGGIPALGVAQWQLGWIGSRFGLRRFARVAMLLSAAVLVWRGFADLANGAAACCGHGSAQ